MHTSPPPPHTHKRIMTSSPVFVSHCISPLIPGRGLACLYEGRSVVVGSTACLCQVSKEDVDEARKVLVEEEKKKVRDEVLACPMGGPATFSTIFQAVQLPHIGSPIYLLPLLQSLCLQSPQSCLHSTVSLPSGVETANLLMCLGINFEGRGSLVAPPPIVCLPVLRAMFLVSPFMVICALLVGGSGEVEGCDGRQQHRRLEGSHLAS